MTRYYHSNQQTAYVSMLFQICLRAIVDVSIACDCNVSICLSVMSLRLEIKCLIAVSTVIKDAVLATVK